MESLGFIRRAKICVVGRLLIANVREYSDGGGLAMSHVRWFSAESTFSSLRIFPQEVRLIFEGGTTTANDHGYLD